MIRSLAVRRLPAAGVAMVLTSALLTTPTAGISIQDDTMTLNLSASKLPDAGSGPISVDDLDAAVGFTVHGGDAGCATGLGVRLRN